MYEEIVAAGFGGQGILRLGKIIAYAAMIEERQVTFMPSYGAEVRGGTANSSVIISDAPIPSPIITHPTCMIIMNPMSFNRFIPNVDAQCLTLVNSSLVSEKRESRNFLFLPFSDEAVRLGNIKVANMVTLGALIAAKRIVSLSTIEKTIKEVFAKVRRELIELNLRAIEKGSELVKKKVLL